MHLWGPHLSPVDASSMSFSWSQAYSCTRYMEQMDELSGVSVEWIFGDIVNFFKFLDVKTT